MRSKEFHFLAIKASLCHILKHGNYQNENRYSTTTIIFQVKSMCWKRLAFYSCTLWWWTFFIQVSGDPSICISIKSWVIASQYPSFSFLCHHPQVPILATCCQFNLVLERKRKEIFKVASYQAHIMNRHPTNEVCDERNCNLVFHIVMLNVFLMCHHLQIFPAS